MPCGDRAGATLNIRFSFDPERVAALETAAWRAYYDREWLKLLYFTERACAEQFHVPFPLSLQAAYYATRGAIAFKPVDNNVPLALAACTRYFEIVRRYSGLTFEPAGVARIEVRYWEVHRRLSGSDDHGELADTFADLHAATFGLPRDGARESAAWRTRAAITVDNITGGRSTDIEGDWRRLKGELRGCYRSLTREIATVSASPARHRRRASGRIGTVV